MRRIILFSFLIVFFTSCTEIYNIQQEKKWVEKKEQDKDTLYSITARIYWPCDEVVDSTFFSYVDYPQIIYGNKSGNSYVYSNSTDYAERIGAFNVPVRLLSKSKISLK